MLPVELKSKIAKSFRGEVLGNGIGLREGQAIDDYETEENIGKARFRDEKLDWSKITAADITRCQSSLSFLDHHFYIDFL